MSTIFAAGLIAAVGVSAYFILRKAKPAAKPAAEFTCRHCNEKHCQCEQQD